MGSIGVNERTVMGMDEYINKKALLDALYDADAITMNGVKILNQFPSADVAQVRRGRWLPFRVGFWTSVFECSECHRRVTLSCDEVRTFEMLNRRYPFCHCGAKMEGEHDG